MDWWELFRRAHMNGVPDATLQKIHGVHVEFDVLKLEIQKLASAVALADLAVTEMQIANQRINDVAHQSPGALPSSQAVDQHDLDELYMRAKRAGHWLLFAARGSVFALYEFRSQLQHIKDVAKERGFSTDFAVETTKDLDQSFPHLKAARDAIAHAGDIRREPVGRGFVGAMKGFLDKPAGGHVVITESLNGRTLVMTRQGTLIKFEIDGSLLVKLQALHRTLEERLTKEVFPLTV